MKSPLPPILGVLAVLAVLAASSAPAAEDPRLTSWLSAPSVNYARLYESDAARTSGTAVTTWARGQGTQSAPSYAGVMQISFSRDWVYLRSSGLGYHVMGPWYLDTAHTQSFPNFPANQNVLYRVPRVPVVSANKTLTGNGVIGYGVDGVAFFDNRDTFSYSTASGQDADPVNRLQGTGVWNRDAYANEGVTFDSAFAHQAGANYHYHANTPALRHQLGDHVEYNATTRGYTESAGAVTRHSPILGWLADGHPVYGPYGYASALDGTSAVRRMVSGYVRRDGANATTDLAATGRTTLPVWATRAQNRAATLAANLQGPPVNATFPLGRYLEDYDYLGELGRTQGSDFDLDLHNGRFCVTPEFPAGTYAYFVTIAADGSPQFPYVIGRWYYGSPTGGAVAAVTETVTEYVRSGPTTPIVIAATASGTGVALNWSSVEGATYRIESSADGATWTTVAAAVTSTGQTTGYAATAAANFFRVTVAAIATFDARAVMGTPVGTMATVPFAGTATTPTITVAPAASAVIAGGVASFSATVGGPGPFSYRWQKDGAAIEGATLAGFSLATVRVADAGFYSVVITNAGGSVTSAVAELTVVVATQAVVGAGYVAGGTATVDQTVSFTGAPARVSWQLLLPVGWRFAASTAVGTSAVPTAGTADLAEWVWEAPLASPLAFRCTLTVPNSATAAVGLSAVLAGRRSDGSTFQVLVTPDPLVMSAAPRLHSADSDQDGRIGLVELTRVIELYNTRSGTVRTGQYHPQSGTEDGFATGP